MPDKNYQDGKRDGWLGVNNPPNNNMFSKEYQRYEQGQEFAQYWNDTFDRPVADRITNNNTFDTPDFPVTTFDFGLPITEPRKLGRSHKQYSRSSYCAYNREGRNLMIFTLVIMCAVVMYVGIVMGTGELILSKIIGAIKAFML